MVHMVGIGGYVTDTTLSELDDLRRENSSLREDLEAQKHLVRETKKAALDLVSSVLCDTHSKHIEGVSFETFWQEEQDIGCSRCVVDKLNDALTRIDALEAALYAIQDRAHNLTTGPTVEDGYWELRALAQEVL